VETTAAAAEGANGLAAALVEVNPAQARFVLFGVQGGLTRQMRVIYNVV
jgi:hypothetical protein